MAKKRTKAIVDTEAELALLTPLTFVCCPDSSSDAAYNPVPIDAAVMLADALREKRIQNESRTPALTLPEHQVKEMHERRAWLRTLFAHAKSIRLLTINPRSKFGKRVAECRDTWIRNGVIETRSEGASRFERGRLIRSYEWTFECVFCEKDLHTVGHGSITIETMRKISDHVDLCAMEYLINRGWE